MRTIRLKEIGSDVVQLQQLLCQWGYTTDETGIFDEQTDFVVRRFQADQRLGVDGIVGARTWALLQDAAARERHSLRLTETDFIRAAKKLGVEIATIRAVQEVETGGCGGFFGVGRPAILFEGHIFWNQLEKNGLNPKDLVSGNENILYPKWTKEHYKGGMEEYKRLAQALKIHEKAAVCSASWGLFQIMGFNYGVCGCANAREFVDKMCSNEGAQLDLFVAFLQANKWDKYLKELDWTEFARRYNGPRYAENRYDEKLMLAYKKYR